MTIDRLTNSEDAVRHTVGAFVVTSNTYGIHIHRNDGDYRVLGLTRTFDPRSPYLGVHDIFGWELSMGIPTESEVNKLWDYVGNDRTVNGDPKTLS